MTTGQLVVIGLRLIVPLLILKRPLAGGIAAMLLDATDVIIVEFFGPGGMGAHYQNIDKGLDLWYLGLEAYVSLSWTERIPRLISVWLFALRLVGVALFELSGWRPLLFIFPNLFENWFLFVLVIWRFFPNVRLDNWRRCLSWLAVLYIPKLGQEYLLHVAEAQPWSWLKDRLGL
ncbi:MAG: hypothetical protein H0T72_05515 [Chloroflexia bacterium]|nr:hypothetical protein [Chloroflexia bacterium]